MTVETLARELPEMADDMPIEDDGYWGRKYNNLLASCASLAAEALQDMAGEIRPWLHNLGAAAASASDQPPPALLNQHDGAVPPVPLPPAIPAKLAGVVVPASSLPRPMPVETPPTAPDWLALAANARDSQDLADIGVTAKASGAPAAVLDKLRAEYNNRRKSEAIAANSQP